MMCSRCQGLMTEEELRDWGGTNGYDRSSAFRCISCGEISDPVILQNRRRGSGQTNGRKDRPRVGARVTRIRPTTPSAVDVAYQALRLSTSAAIVRLSEPRRSRSEGNGSCWFLEG
jgi:hypothetical protein